jgi:exosortase A
MRATLLLLAGVVVLLGLHFDVARATVAIWSRFFTYQHGFIVFPVSAWLIWQRRHELAACTPAPDLRALPLMLLLSCAALAGRLGGVLALEQIALVLMIPTLIWAALGARMTRVMAFPLAFLLFAVPVGDFLVPPLMEFTADFTVTMVRLTGIPIYREGQMISLPSGEWSVVEGCSGIRYLIAALVLGTVYAYLTYRSLKRRLIFVALSLIVPVIANGLRAFLIVMIGHYSDMQYAVGVDHLIYGWGFFGIVMFLLFMIGARWREDEAPRHASEDAVPLSDARWPVARVTGAAVLALALAAIPAIWGAWLDRPASRDASLALALPETAAGWQAGAAPFTDWANEERIHWKRPLGEARGVYAKDGGAVLVFASVYRLQRQDPANLPPVDVEARLARDRWTKVAFGTTALEGGLALSQTSLRRGDERLLVWRWSATDGYRGPNYYRLRARMVGERIAGRPALAADVVLVTPYEERPKEAEAALRAFVREAMPAIDAALDGARSAQASRS